jgi:hypothetical protein
MTNCESRKERATGLSKRDEWSWLSCCDGRGHIHATVLEVFVRYSRPLISVVLATLAAFSLCVQAAHADEAGSAAAESGPAPYGKFITGAQVQNGLFNVIRKNGKVYLEIAPSQLDQDFIQSAETVNGLGGYFVVPGGITSWTRIVRFTRNENKIVVTWPNTYFIAPGNDPAQQAISRTAANSTVAVAPIVATDATSGHVVFDASFFLSDIYNLALALKQVTGADKPDQAYSLDSDRTLANGKHKLTRRGPTIRSLATTCPSPK